MSLSPFSLFIRVRRIYRPSDVFCSPACIADSRCLKTSGSNEFSISKLTSTYLNNVWMLLYILCFTTRTSNCVFLPCSRYAKFTLQRCKELFRNFGLVKLFVNILMRDETAFEAENKKIAWIRPHWFCRNSFCVDEVCCFTK